MDLSVAVSLTEKRGMYLKVCLHELPTDEQSSSVHIHMNYYNLIVVVKSITTQFLIPGEYTGVTGGQLLKLNKHPWMDVSGV